MGETRENHLEMVNNIFIQGPSTISPLDSLGTEDVKAWNRHVSQLYFDGAKTQGNGGKGQGLQDFPHNKCSLCRGRLYGQVSTFLRQSSLQPSPTTHSKQPRDQKAREYIVGY